MRDSRNRPRPARWRLVACLLVAALALTGCSGVGSTGASGGPVEVTFSHWALTAPPFDAFNKVIDDFNRSQNEFVVKPENIPYKNYHQTVFTRAAAGEGSTMIAVDSSELANAVQSGLAADITDTVGQPSGRLSTYEQSLTVDGRRHAVTFTRHPYALLVNRDRLAQHGQGVPKTFAEFEAVARAGTAPPDSYGFAFRHTTADTNGWWLDLSNWIHGAGGRWSDASGRPTLNTPEVATGLTRMKSFMDNRTVPVGMDAPTYRRLFWEGKIPMLVESLAFAGIFAAQSPTLAESLEVHRLPFEHVPYLSSNNPVFVNAAASEEERRGAEQFLTFMLTDRVQQQMVDTLGGALVAKDIPLSDATLRVNPWLRTWKSPDSRLDFTPPGVGARFPAFRKAVLDQVERILAGRVSVREGLERAQADAEAAVRR